MLQLLLIIIKKKHFLPESILESSRHQHFLPDNLLENAEIAEHPCICSGKYPPQRSCEQYWPPRLHHKSFAGVAVQSSDQRCYFWLPNLFDEKKTITANERSKTF